MYVLCSGGRSVGPPAVSRATHGSSERRRRDEPNERDAAVEQLVARRGLAGRRLEAHLAVLVGGRRARRLASDAAALAVAVAGGPVCASGAAAGSADAAAHAAALGGRDCRDGRRGRHAGGRAGRRRHVAARAAAALAVADAAAARARGGGPRARAARTLDRHLE